MDYESPAPRLVHFLATGQIVLRYCEVEVPEHRHGSNLKTHATHDALGLFHRCAPARRNLFDGGGAPRLPVRMLLAVREAGGLGLRV